MSFSLKIRKRLKSSKNRFVKFAKNYYTKQEPSQWPTKSFDVWLLIWILLYKTRPQKIVEFGGGRSTNLLAEYAFKMSAKLLTFEQDKQFVTLIKRGLRISNLPEHYVVHAPISGDWFDIACIDRHLDTTADFIFIDAPGGAANAGSRGSAAGIDYIARLAAKDATLVYDDTHREEVELALQSTLDKIGGDYVIGKIDYALINTNLINSISICVPKFREDELKRSLMTLYTDGNWKLIKHGATGGGNPSR